MLHILGGAEQFVSSVLGVLSIISLCLPTALAQAPRQVRRSDCAAQIEIFGRFCDGFRDVEIGRIV